MKKGNKAKVYKDMSFKWKDYRLQEVIEEKKLDEDSYHSGAIEDFIKKNDDGDEYNIPRIKVFGGKGDTKFLNVSFDALRQIAKILKKMKLG